MMVHPPCAKTYLEEEYAKSEKLTPCITEFEVQTPMIEEECADDALCNIVGETHSSIRHDKLHWLVEFYAIETKQQSSYYHEHKACLVNRAKDEQKWSVERSYSQDS